MKNILLPFSCTLALLSSATFAGFDFCQDSSSTAGGSGSFQQDIIKDEVVDIGEIPRGINNLRITLTSAADLDIQLFDKADSTKIIQWPDGLLNKPRNETKTYADINYEWSGYSGDCPTYSLTSKPENCSYGNEFIQVHGSTNKILVMKAFGYQAGEAIVEYTWDGGQADGCEVSENGQGQFHQTLEEKVLVDIGEIPAGLNNIDIRLSSIKDLDIQLIDKATGKKIVEWPNGLLNGAFPDGIEYQGLDYTWSGYAGDCPTYDKNVVPEGCSYGNEYITITGTTNTTLVMKAYAYESGVANVEYRWGHNSNYDSTALLAKYAPVMSFYEDDNLPSPIESFIEQAVLYKKTLLSHSPIAYGIGLPETIYKQSLFSRKKINTRDNPLTVANFPAELKGSDTYVLDFLNQRDVSLSARDIINYRDADGERLIFDHTDVMNQYNRVIYGRVVEQNSRIYLQYHFFYIINQWNGNGGRLIGFHEGDWEGMMVELDNQLNPLRVATSIHLQIFPFKGGETENWSNISRSGTHPIVFIGKGGHPTYLDKGITAVAFGLTGLDHHEGTGLILRHNFDTDVDMINPLAIKKTYRIINIEENKAVSDWLTAKVSWGSDYTDLIEKSVTSVKFFDPDRWSNPMKWMDDRE